jgi:hypothetical protein
MQSELRGSLIAAAIVLPIYLIVAWLVCRVARRPIPAGIFWSVGFLVVLVRYTIGRLPYAEMDSLKQALGLVGLDFILMLAMVHIAAGHALARGRDRRWGMLGVLSGWGGLIALIVVGRLSRRALIDGTISPPTEGAEPTRPVDHSTGAASVPPGNMGSLSAPNREPTLVASELARPEKALLGEAPELPSMHNSEAASGCQQKLRDALPRAHLALESPTQNSAHAF